MAVVSAVGGPSPLADLPCTGTDVRDASGNGVIALVTGSMSQRSLGANLTWITLEIPEPNAILAASTGLFALFDCHQLVRRRSR